MILAAPVLHYCLPGHEMNRAVPLIGERIGSFLERTGWAQRCKIAGRWRYCFKLPTVCLVNGEYVLQRHWRRRRITESDRIAFLSRPLGGGGNGQSGNTKAVLGIVALIAVAAFAFWAGPLIGGLAATGFGFGSAATWGTLFTQAIILGGALLINALVTPKTGGANPDEDVPQVYSLGAGGNAARPMQTIPCRYGRLKRFVDYATAPWSEFVGDEQYLHVILCEGVGTFDHHQLFIDDTVLWDSVGGFSPQYSAQLEFVPPGNTVTLFPADVVTSVEVNGQTLPEGTGTLPSGTAGAYVGGFIVNAAGTSANILSADFVYPGGAFSLNQNGTIAGRRVKVEVEARQVDNAGAPIGSFAVIGFIDTIFRERKPKRITVKGAVPGPAGRYEIRARRFGAEPDPDQGADTVIWVSARAYLVGDQAFPGVSCTAIRIRATELTQGAIQRFGILSTRILPVWTGAAFVNQPTRNPAWAFYDMATNVDYGAKRPVSKIDFQAINTLAAGCNTRGDHFDYDFTSGLPAPDVFDTILKTARARHCWSGDILSLVRDELKTVPQLLLTDREISRGSLSVGYSFQAADTADCVVLEYLDETTWAPADVQWPSPAALPSPTNPARLRVDGVVERSKAQEQAAFYWRQNIHRRTTASLNTEWDGKMLAFGSYIRVQSELPQTWGAAGRVLNRVGLILTLDPAPKWPVGQNYIEIRTARGKRWGPCKIAQGTSPDQGILDGADLTAVEAAQGPLANALARAPGAEDPSFALGLASARAMDCIVLRGQPSGDRVTLSLVVDDPNVHDDDIPDPADLPPGPMLSNPGAPIIAGLTANFDQGQVEPTLRASWFPAPGAIYYVAQVSYDAGASWGQVYEGSQPMFMTVVDYAALDLRVMGVGARPGPWMQISVVAPTIVPRLEIQLANFEQGLEDYVTNQFDAVTTQIDFLQQQIAANAAEQDAQNWLEKRAVVDQQAIINDTAEKTTASLTTVVKALDVSVVQNQTAIQTINGTMIGTWSIKVDAAGHVSGIQLFGTPTTSVLDINVDVFRVAFPTADPRGPQPVFQIANVNGVAKIALRGDVYADGTITANSIIAGAITTVKLDAGAVNATKIAINGVEIQNILAGSATIQAFQSFSGASGFGLTSYGSAIAGISVTLTSGIAYVDCDFSFIRAAAAANQSSWIGFFINGVLAREWRIISGSFVPVSVRTVFTPGAGTWNFDVRLKTDSGVMDYGSGTFMMQELRK